MPSAASFCTSAHPPGPGSIEPRLHFDSSTAASDFASLLQVPVAVEKEFNDVMNMP